MIAALVQYFHVRYVRKFVQPISLLRYTINISKELCGITSILFICTAPSNTVEDFTDESEVENEVNSRFTDSFMHIFEREYEDAYRRSKMCMEQAVMWASRVQLLHCNTSVTWKL